MGWLFGSHSRKSVIDERIAPNTMPGGTHTVIAHCTRGNVLWTVNEIKFADGETKRYIGCTLMERHGSSWGYKEMGESMHPYYYTCPLRYLDMAPEENAKWREGVREYNRASGAVRALRAKRVWA